MKPSARRVRDRLRQGPATTHHLCDPDVGGVRFGARIGELRDAGYVIREERCRQGSHLYTLISEPSPAATPTVTPVPAVEEAFGEFNTLFDAGEFRHTRSPYEDAA